MYPVSIGYICLVMVVCLVMVICLVMLICLAMVTEMTRRCESSFVRVPIAYICLAMNTDSTLQFDPKFCLCSQYSHSSWRHISTDKLPLFRSVRV